MNLIPRFISNIFTGYAMKEAGRDSISPLPEAPHIDSNILENGWVRMADVIPGYLAHAKNNNLGFSTNSVFFMSSDLGTKIVNQEISSYIPKSNVVRPEEAFIPVADALALIEGSGKSAVGIIKCVHKAQNRDVGIDLDDEIKGMYTCSLLALRDAIDDNKVLLSSDIENNRSYIGYFKNETQMPPPYSLSTEGDASFHFVLRRGENVPISRVGASPSQRKLIP